VRACSEGPGAEALCVTDAAGRAFVAYGAVVAVDAVSDQLRGVWTDYCYPIGLYADSAHGKLYCLSEWPGVVTAIDPFLNRVLNTAVLNGYPKAMALNNVVRKAYVAVERDEGTGDAIVVLDAVGDTVLAEIAVARAPDFLAYDADDDLLFAASAVSDWILVIDGKTDAVTDSTRVSDDCGGLVYNPARHRVYSLSTIDEVTAFTPRVSGQNREMAVDVPLQYAVLNADGTKLFGISPDKEAMYFLDCVSERLAGVVSLPATPTALCYAAPYDELYVAYGEEGEGTSVMDCSQRSVKAVVPINAYSLYWDVGTDAVYCFGDTGLAVVDGGMRRIVATRQMGAATGVASAPGWPRVYVADYDESYLMVIRADEWSQVREPADVRATVVRGSLVWTGTPTAMYDKCGRRVADVRHGTNDVSGLSPGVYFVRQNGVPRGTYARKVIITQ
jgi:DNA-binding beta-propeller fold protein YncE